MLTPKSFGTVFLGNIFNAGIRDSTDDSALSAAARIAQFGLVVTRPLTDLNQAAARTLRQVGVISRLPKGVDGVERSLSRLIERPTGINWRVIFKRSYKQAEKQAVFCRALADTDATSFVNPSLGGYAIGNIGSVLGSVRLKAKYPAIFALISDIHEKRYVSSLSHAMARKTGKPTGRIKHKYLWKAKTLMRRAFAEVRIKW